MMIKRIMGIDPSFNRTGLCVIEQTDGGARLVDTGIIVPRGADRPAQLLSISQQFEVVVDKCCAGAAYFERPGAWQRRGGTRRETIEVLSMSRAVMILACAARGVAAHNVDVHIVRRAMFGRVNATSKDVFDLVERSGFELPRRPRGGPDADIANAIVMALYGLRFG